MLKDIQITAVSLTWWWGPEWCNKMFFPHFFIRPRYLRNQFEDKDCWLWNQSQAIPRQNEAVVPASASAVGTHYVSIVSSVKDDNLRGYVEYVEGQFLLSVGKPGEMLHIWKPHLWPRTEVSLYLCLIPATPEEESLKVLLASNSNQNLCQIKGLNLQEFLFQDTSMTYTILLTWHSGLPDVAMKSRLPKVLKHKPC